MLIELQQQNQYTNSNMTSTQPEKPKLMVENISCVIPESETIGGLYVGNTYGAQNADILKEYGIRAVLTSSIETPINYDPVAIPFHLKIQAHDKENYMIIDHLDECMDFIHRCRQLTNVYVHCYAGVSRSVTIVVAYLMKYWRWGLNQAIQYVQAKRVVAKPNDGFMEQLKKYEQTVANAVKLATKQVSNTTSPNISPVSLGPSNYTSVPSSLTPQPTMTPTSTPSYKFEPPTPRRHSQIPIPKVLTLGLHKRDSQQSVQRREEARSSNYHSSSLNHNQSQSKMGWQYSTSGGTGGGFYSQGNTFGGSNNLANTFNGSSNLGGTLDKPGLKVGKPIIRPRDLPGYKA